MQLLVLLHRWTGGVAGLLLAIVALSGTVLVWEESWVSLPGAGDAPTTDPAGFGRVVEAALAEDAALSRITFGNADMALHQAIYADGGGAYIAPEAVVVDRWDSMWGRPELWLFDLHHYLFMGETGKYLTGALGLLLLAFTITGLILWWRTRKTFRFRLWPARMTRSAIVWHHRDIGVLASPLLLLAAFTSSMMIFPALSDVLLSPWGEEEQAEPVLPTDIAAPDADTDWHAVFANAQAAFPGAAPRRLMLPKERGAPLALRMLQPFEWTPNGRTYVYLDPADGSVVATRDPAQSDTASAISEKYYPVHAGKVGGFLWRLLLTFGGLALMVLGTLATWSFWFGGKAPERTTRKAAVAA